MKKLKNIEEKSDTFDTVSDHELSSKQLQLMQQRDHVAELVTKGFSLTQISNSLGVSLSTVKRRLAERREENLEDFKITSKMSRLETASELLSKYKLIERTLWAIVSDSTKHSDKIAAIDKINDVDTKKIKVLQMLGYLPKDGALFDEARPMVVYFKGMVRPDRTEQLSRTTS